jgi:hypothetical protein
MRPTDETMRKWKEFPSIVARRRNARSPDRHFTDFHQLLHFRMSIHPKGIRAYYWAITYAKRDMPKIDIIIQWHRRATAADTACITAALEEAFENNATLSIAVTNDSKAFRSIVAQRIL